MKTKLFSLIFILLLGHLAWGQGAATPELAFANGVPNAYWFELDVDSDGSTWIFRDVNARTLPFNTGLTSLLVFPIPLLGQTSFDASVNVYFGTGYMSNVGYVGYEEWYVIKVPSTKNIDITVDISLALNNDPNGNDAYRWGTTIQWYQINDASEIANIGKWPLESNYGIETAILYESTLNPLMNFNITSTSLSEKYVLLRIGNNSVLSFLYAYLGLIQTYTLTISTNNNVCENALNFPDNGLETPFISSTVGKNLLTGSSESDLVGPYPGAVGSDGIIVNPSNGNGEWFVINTEEANLSFAACGSDFDTQILILDDCPTGGTVIGAENNNLLDGTDPNGNGGTDVCKNPADPTGLAPVVRVATGASSGNEKPVYAYLFGDNASGTINLYILRDNNGILPVDWLEFTGSPMGNTNKLHWSTATETQNDYFKIEKSDDGIYYENMAQIPGQGDAIFQNDYSILDESPFYQTYYRISQVDYDGTVNEGPQTVVINESKKVFIHLIANPVLNQEINLRTRSDREQEVVFTLTGTDGKAVRSQPIPLIEGAAEFSIPIPDLAPGMYILSATLNNERWVEKVVVR